MPWLFLKQKQISRSPFTPKLQSIEAWVMDVREKISAQYEEKHSNI